MSNKLQDEMEEVIHEAGDVLHDVLEAFQRKTSSLTAITKNWSTAFCCSGILRSAWL